MPVAIELVRHGRQLMGEPYFTVGLPIPLDLKGFGALGVGDLAIVHSGRGRLRIDRALGSARRIENVLEALLWEQGALGELEGFQIPEPSLDGRVDLRGLIAITIDPVSAKDFDDALSFRRESEGIRAFVHIADVSYYVPAGSPLDQGATLRALSTYVPGLVAPMLPHELTDDACSLRPDRDRLCVTVEIPPSGEPLFYRSVIRSRARLTYGEAERRVGSAEVREQLELAGELAGELRRRRRARGALEVATPELSFSFDDGAVASARREGEPYAHMLVEELMIAANEHVAAFLAGRRRPALYRVHEPPESRSIELLAEKLAALEVPTPPLPEKFSPAAAASLAARISVMITDYVSRSNRGREAFPSLVLRSLKQARYDPQNLGHSGLASTAYCHFTSPIRRYPDLVVHRALLAELGLGSDEGPKDMETLALHVSAREREAAQLEYLADDICLAWLLEDTLHARGWVEPFAGEITGIIGSGLFVRFGDVFEGLLPARRLPGEFFELNETATALVGRRSGRTYRLGDPVAIRVESIAKGEGKVELALGELPLRTPRQARRTRR